MREETPCSACGFSGIGVISFPFNEGPLAASCDRAEGHQASTSSESRAQAAARLLRKNVNEFSVKSNVIDEPLFCGYTC